MLGVYIGRGCLDTDTCMQREGNVAIHTAAGVCVCGWRETKKRGLEYML